MATPENAEQAEALCLSNSQSCELLLWLEPWAEEFAIGPRAQLTLIVMSDKGRPRAPEVEMTESHLVVYAAGGTRISVHIDGVQQDSGSAEQPAPAGDGLSARTTIHALFDGFSDSRPAGKIAPSATMPVSRSMWAAIKRFFVRPMGNTVAQDLGTTDRRDT